MCKSLRKRWFLSLGEAPPFCSRMMAGDGWGSLRTSSWLLHYLIAVAHPSFPLLLCSLNCPLLIFHRCLRLNRWQNDWHLVYIKESKYEQGVKVQLFPLVFSLLLYSLMGVKPSRDLKICDNAQLLCLAVAWVCGYRGYIQKSSGLRRWVFNHIFFLNKKKKKKEKALSIIKDWRTTSSTIANLGFVPLPLGQWHEYD